MVFFSALCALRLHSRYGDRDLRLTFFDVGQGDAALLEFPSGRTLLIDAGGGFGDWNIGKRELLPELARMSVLSLDAVLLSHPDQDHAYGFLGIFENFPVGTFWLNASFARDEKKKPLLKDLLGILRLKKTSVWAVEKRSDLEWDGAKLTLYPLALGRSTNNRALVLSLEFHGCRAFFAADIEEKGEKALLEAGLPVGPVDLLKVAHHGSRTSSSEAFLLRARPHWAIVSVGLANRYGHPGTGVLKKLRSGGAEVFRTDFHGFVRFRFTQSGKVECRSAQGFCGVSTCR